MSNDDVFSKDPFLLDKESRDVYGRQLLHNILLRRTTLHGKEKVGDLHGRPKIPARPTPEPPPADVVERYKQTRIWRKALKKEEQEALEKVTMVSDGSRTARRREDIEVAGVTKPKFATHDEARKDLRKNGADLDQRLDKRLRIAAVGFRVKISAVVEQAYLEENLCPMRRPPGPPQTIEGIPDTAGIQELGRTKLVKDEERTKRWTDTLCNHIQTAIQRGSQLVVVPEFALPPPCDGDALEARLRECCLPGPDGKKRHNHFVFAGSRHEGGSNRGLLLHLKDEKLPGEPKWHYKTASARTLGENILGPRPNALTTYEADVTFNNQDYPFEVTVAICYDTFDPSTFLSLVANGAVRGTRGEERIILVPSFNPSKRFVDFLRDLSFLTASTVIYVNGLHGDAKMFIAGFAIGDLLDQSSGTVIKQIKAALRKEGRAKNRELKKAKEKAASTPNREEGKGVHAQRVDALNRLLNGIEVLRMNGGLRHLITVEGCEECANGTHTDDYDCKTDILYYNIDARLLDTLNDWKRNFFRSDESFLPEPFREDTIQELTAILKKRESVERRDAVQERKAEKSR